MDAKALLIKYVCHVAVAEGVSFATDLNLSPAEMKDMEFTDEEERFLKEEVFPVVRAWWAE